MLKLFLAQGNVEVSQLSDVAHEHHVFNLLYSENINFPKGGSLSINFRYIFTFVMFFPIDCSTRREH